VPGTPLLCSFRGARGPPYRCRTGRAPDCRGAVIETRVIRPSAQCAVARPAAGPRVWARPEREARHSTAHPGPSSRREQVDVVTEMTGPGTVVIGVVADPDLPARLARDLASSLPAALAREDDRIDWEVEVLDDPFEAMYPDIEYIIDKAARHVRNTSWDLALCLTDLPM